MHTPGTTPVLTEEAFGLVALVAAAVYLVVRWVREGKPNPDPWELEGSDVGPSEGNASASPICVRCLTPHAETAYFCPQCGHAVGPYSNYMPFLQLFSEGEVMRSATDGSKRMTPFRMLGYALLSLATFSFFAPIFWVALWNRYSGQKATTSPPKIG